MENKVMDKIKKLLAKAEGTNNEAEAQAFLFKAQELMAKNNLDMEDLKVDSDSKEIIEDVVLSGKKTTAARNLTLALIIAKNFKVEVMLSRRPGIEGKVIVFLGFKEDIKIANMTFTSISKFMEKRRRQIYKQAQKEGRETKGIREAYTQGFLKGLEEGFWKNVTEKGLVVVTPEEVRNRAQEICGNNKTTFTQKDKRGTKEYSEGYKDGKGYGTQLN